MIAVICLDQRRGPTPHGTNLGAEDGSSSLWAIFERECASFNSDCTPCVFEPRRVLIVASAITRSSTHCKAVMCNARGLCRLSVTRRPCRGRAIASNLKKSNRTQSQIRIFSRIECRENVQCYTASLARRASCTPSRERRTILEIGSKRAPRCAHRQADTRSERYATGHGRGRNEDEDKSTPDDKIHTQSPHRTRESRTPLHRSDAERALARPSATYCTYTVARRRALDPHGGGLGMGA